jgi:hypothetical protein
MVRLILHPMISCRKHLRATSIGRRIYLAREAGPEGSSRKLEKPWALETKLAEKNVHTNLYDLQEAVETKPGWRRVKVKLDKGLPYYRKDKEGKHIDVGNLSKGTPFYYWYKKEYEQDVQITNNDAKPSPNVDYGEYTYYADTPLHTAYLT